MTPDTPPDPAPSSSMSRSRLVPLIVRRQKATSASSTAQQLALSPGLGAASQLLNLSLSMRGAQQLAVVDFAVRGFFDGSKRNNPGSFASRNSMSGLRVCDG